MNDEKVAMLVLSQYFYNIIIIFSSVLYYKCVVGLSLLPVIHTAALSLSPSTGHREKII